MASSTAVKRNQLRWSRSGERERLAELSRARWADPQYKARTAAAISRAHNSFPVWLKLSEAARSRWQRPEYREAIIAAVRRSHSSQQYRQMMSELRKAQWQDPAVRERYLKALRTPERRALQREVLARALAKRQGRIIVRQPMEPKRVFQPKPQPFSIFGKRIKLPPRNTGRGFTEIE